MEATVTAGVKGWRLDDGEVWVFVRDASREGAKGHHPGLRHDYDEMREEMEVMPVPQLDGTGAAGEVSESQVRDHVGFWVCLDCQRWTAFGPCRHHGEEIVGMDVEWGSFG